MQNRLYLSTDGSLVPQAIHDTSVGLHLLQVLYANILQRNAYTLLPANKLRQFRVQRELRGISVRSVSKNVWKS